METAVAGPGRWQELADLKRLPARVERITPLAQGACVKLADGSWWRASTWAGGWRLLFGHQGLVRLGFGPWRRYLHADFHPSQGDGAPAERWLAAHAALVPPVRQAD